MAQQYLYVWPYYYPQQEHPYFQFPITTDSGSTHRPSRSWQGSPHMSPAVLPTLLSVVQAPAPPVDTPVTPFYQRALLHPGYSGSRRHSFHNAYVPVQPAAPAVTSWPSVPAPYFTYSPGWALTPVDLPGAQLHDLINGEIIPHQLYVNFAGVHLVFKKRTGSSHHDVTTMSRYELEQPATNPQMTHLRVVCDAIPQWPVDLQVIGTSMSPHRRRRSTLPYLTLEDVLHAVHATLHRQISHWEWACLSTSQEMDVACAYTRRCKSSGSCFSVRQQQSEGVKRVDFLLENTWFKGFTWLEPESGVERLKLHLGQEY
jgi:hypothetical protein